LQVRCGEFVGSVSMAEGPRGMLTNGTWDACGQLVAQAAQIRDTAAKLPYVHW
jgi:3-isopropylmalate/(R)-2-methylmalate dehydratase small subunit